jgi:hypothetical protein
MKLRLAIIQMLVIVCYCNGFGQIIEPIGGGWFKIDHQYAQQIAVGKDSLKAIKALYYQTGEVLQGCVQKLSISFEHINTHKMQANKLQAQVVDFQSMVQATEMKIETLTESRNFLQGALATQAKKCNRAKFWQVGAGVGGGLLIGLITGLLIR